MAFITTIDKPKYGIRQPVLAHQWKVFFPVLPEDANDMIASQTVYCKLNLVAKTFEMRIEQPQGVSGILRSIDLIAKHGTDIEVHHLDGGGNIGSFYKISGKLIEQHYDLDYSLGAGVAAHILKFGDVKLIGDHIIAVYKDDNIDSI